VKTTENKKRRIRQDPRIFIGDISCIGTLVITVIVDAYVIFRKPRFDLCIVFLLSLHIGILKFFYLSIIGIFTESVKSLCIYPKNASDNSTLSNSTCLG